MHRYGIYTLTLCFLGLGGYALNKKVLNPPEYETKEEKQSKCALPLR